MVTRVTVTLPDDVLLELDGVAHAEGVTRSEVVREAAVTYLAGRGESQETRLRHDAVTDGIAWLMDVADRHAGDGESGLAVLRDLRGDRSGATPHSGREVDK